MISREKQTLLTHLARTETLVASIYEAFSRQDHFPGPVRDFWEAMMSAELEHARLFETIREKLGGEPSIQLDINYDMVKMTQTGHELQSILGGITEGKISEVRAYELGAYIEERLAEFAFSKRIKIQSRDITESIRRVENDTKDHYRLLHNYALGKISPIKPPSMAKMSDDE